MNQTTGKLFFVNEDGEKQEIGTTANLDYIGIDLAEGEDEQVTTLCNKEVTFSIKPTYKEWHKKRKGKRYIYYYITKEGFDPKVINMLLGR